MPRLTELELETLGAFLYCLAFTIQDIDDPKAPPLTSATFLEGLKGWVPFMSRLAEIDPVELDHLMGWVESAYHDARRKREEEANATEGNLE